MPRLMAALYDSVLGVAERRGLARWRAEVLAPLHGRVLEIGAGTGLNLPYYPRTVTELVLAEPDRHMRARLARQAAVAPVPVTISDAPASPLPFADASFDGVVMTLVLCTIADVPGALGEARRILRRGGTLAFLEHVGAEEGSRRLRWQRRMEPLWRPLAGNCHLTRRTVDEIRAAQFTVRLVRSDDLPGLLRLGSPVVRGIATPSAGGG
ncbi:MAG TPA: class I SAM-dependent methyltransferase [Gemmatimonadaceae bacterium]|nr:class I SAM-dependent methyltransferase [Gemmatimonadaceae bacterium]